MEHHGIPQTDYDIPPAYRTTACCIFEIALSRGPVEQYGEVFVGQSDVALLGVGNAATPVPAHDAVPRGVVHLIEVLFDALGDVLLCAVQLDGLCGTEYRGPLHLQRHVGGLDFELRRLLVERGGARHRSHAALVPSVRGTATSRSTTKE